MARYALSPGLEIRMEREPEIVESYFPRRVPDQQWKHVDKNGHAHVWVGDDLPTLGEVVVGKSWIGDDLDGYEVDVTEHHCLVCAEVVTPGYTTRHEPQISVGPPRYVLMIHPGLQVQEYPIPDEDVEALVGILQRMFQP